MVSHANWIMGVQTHRLIGMTVLVIRVSVAGIVLVNDRLVRKCSVAMAAGIVKASARHSVTKTVDQ